ncbi:DUF1559 family PulG-like putative transporter [Crateriforma conspicua]|uniref:DUF1559 domain-containing protein n=1 Tax=Crateriforma conspicua TaxID=2527996 RepID=A0A5C5XYK6_9PLAN|nr:DUF1559 domain-containing protein [Crateriforma conspicua]TWT67788.1 hypothetical protein Pan14r_00250 [Crateriforma conspicua]
MLCRIYRSRQQSFCMTRSAVTLIELVTFFAIASILVALILPAVNASRESARGVQCGERLRQLGLATHLFHGAHKVLPGNGRRGANRKIPALDGEGFRPYTNDFFARQRFFWGVGSPKFSPWKQEGSWCFALFPQLELQACYVDNVFLPSIAVFNCPSRSRGGPAQVPHLDTYGDYGSGGHSMAKTDFAANGWKIRNLPEFSSFRDFGRGTSNTLLFGEKAFDQTVQVPTSWYWDEPVYLGGSAGTARRGFGVVPDGVGIPFRENWGSPHPGYASFVFADGALRRVANTVDKQTFIDLLDPDSQDWVQQ